MIRVVAVAALAGCVSEPGLPAEQGVARHWVKRDGFQEPGKLFSPRLGYDSLRDRVVLYGGGNQSAQLDAMYELGPSGWTQLCEGCLGSIDPAGDGGCFLSAFAYDAVGDRFVLFGGEAPDGSVRDGLWQYQGRWQYDGHAAGPTARRRTQLVDDTGVGDLRLIGGADDTGAFMDTWTLVGTTFTEDAQQPSVTFTADASEATYDDDHGRVLALPDDGSGLFDDLWQHTAAGWTPVCSACTGQPRSGASIVHVPVYDQTFVIGGRDAQMNLIAGTWVLVGNALVPFHTDVDLPTRSHAGVIYDRARDVVVLYGGFGDDADSGCGADNICASTWELVRD